jgi:uncharacterized protein (DUF1501 family)
MPRDRLSRRELLTLAATGAGAASLSGWLGPLAARGAAQAARGTPHKSCIVLWMDGGPSHLDTFDPKPDAPESVRGVLRPIDTAVPGLLISEKFPRLAPLMGHAAVLRGMSTEEADHGRARLYLHTGYKPGAGGQDYPALGATVAAELGSPDDALPNFVVTGTPLNKYDFVGNPGYRGPLHQPLALPDPAKGLADLHPAVPAGELGERLTVLEELEQGFARTRPGGAVEDRRAALGRALRLMRSGKGQAFDLSREAAPVRDAYGDNDFGRGCLLARRLVEAGVAFVEVSLANWDTHEKATAEQALRRMAEVDAGLSALLTDLKDRGLLQTTLVVWMGEFGRTPRVNNNGGRDHWARAWTTVLFGGGIKGGQVVGKTDREGGTVLERPVAVTDFMATVCRALGIRHDKTVTAAGGRPVRIVDKGERVVEELF